MRIPILPTLLVAAAVAAMIGLGVWQIQRAEWKEHLIAELEASGGPRPMAIDCAIKGPPEVRAGASVVGEPGYRYLATCVGTSMRVDLGWSKRPDLKPSLGAAERFNGLAAVNPTGRRDVLVLNDPIPPLERSAVPSVADLPNNHLSYAVQWFFFAAAAAVIYVLALRRRASRAP